MKIQFRKLGRLLKTRLIQRERTPAWAVALAFLLYPLGFSLRKTAQVLAQQGVSVAHTSVWYWLHAYGGKLKVWQGDLPDSIVVDETWVKVAGRDCWIFTALDPKTWRVVYLEPSFRRDEAAAEAFFQHLAQAYGAWPKCVISDGGPWYRAVLAFQRWTRGLQWQVVKGGVRSSIEGFYGEFLKRRIKDFDKYFPSARYKLRRVKEWLRLYAWFHNTSRLGGDPLPI